MRVLLDANIIIRMLLRSPNPARSVDVILDAGLRREITFLLTSELRREVVTKIGEKRFLSQRITHDRAVTFLDQLAGSSIVLPTRASSPDAISRDPKDDYLLAYAESGHADYLVTGDEDLLVLDGRFPFRIVRPPELLAILREQGLA